MTRSHLLFAMCCIVWGTTWIAIKAGVTSVPPVFFAGTRFTIAGAVLLAVAGRGRGLATLRPDLPRLAVVTLLMITATYGLLFWGAQFISSGLAAILDLAFTPVALLGLGVLFGEERFTLMRAVGLALGIAGLLVLFGPKALDGTEATLLWFAGGAAMVVSAITYALGSVLARPLLNRHPAVLVSGLTTFGGGLLLTAAALAVECARRAGLRRNRHRAPCARHGHHAGRRLAHPAPAPSARSAPSTYVVRRDCKPR